jgi:mannosyl-3-phosphoglycerate phosphatase
VQRLLVFTDLDGTLLDAQTFSWEAARPALSALHDNGAVVIPTTSKTRAEVGQLQAELGVTGAAVVENGAAIFGDAEWLRPPAAIDGADGGWELSLGPVHGRVVDALDVIARRLHAQVRPLSRMTKEEAVAATGLSGSELRAARQRCHSEPFLAPRAGLEDLRAAARELGLEITAGGRFFSIGGRLDKGDAVQLLSSACSGRGGTAVTVGLGDSLNDAALLQAVDYPVLIPKPDGTHDPLVLGVSVRLCLAEQPAPAGWATAMLRILDCWRSGSLNPRTERLQT